MGALGDMVVVETYGTQLEGRPMSTPREGSGYSWGLTETREYPGVCDVRAPPPLVSPPLASTPSRGSGIHKESRHRYPLPAHLRNVGDAH